MRASPDLLLSRCLKAFPHQLEADDEFLYLRATKRAHLFLLVHWLGWLPYLQGFSSTFLIHLKEQYLLDARLSDPPQRIPLSEISIHLLPCSYSNWRFASGKICQLRSSQTPLSAGFIIYLKTKEKEALFSTLLQRLWPKRPIN